MAMYDEKWKQAEAARIAKNRAGAVSTAGSVGNWAAYGGAQPGPAKPMFTAPDYTKPNPTNQPVMTTAVPKPAVAAPKPMPAPMPGASATTANKSPSQSMTLDQANAREVNAQTARRPGTQAGAGAPPAAGAAALPMPQRPNEVIGQYNGRNITRGQADAYASKLPTSNGPVAMGPNNSFAYTPSGGSPAAPIERPTPAPAGPAPDAPSGPAPRKADSSAAREAEKAAAKFRSDIGSEIFRLSFAAGRGGRDGRAAKEAIASLMGLAGQSIEGSGKRAVDVSSGDRDAAAGADKTGAEQAGADRRAQIDFRAKQMQDGTERYKADLSAIERPTYRTDRDGNLLSVAGTAATNVVGPDGQPVREAQTAVAQQRDYSKEADDKLIADLLDMQRDPMTGALAPNAVQAAQQQFQQLRGAQNPQPAAPAGMKQVGTSGGKPVYEDAKGNRFTL